MDYNLQILILIVIMVVMIIVVIIEMRFLRKRREARSRKEPLHDQAHNAIVNARAISNTLSRDGTDLSHVNDMIMRADQALKQGDARGSLDLTDQAKEAMKTVKIRSDKEIEPTSGEGFSETEPTTKELLKDKFPDNYLETKFSRSLASETIEKARSMHLDVSEAERLLAHCDERASQEDYTQALSYAIQSKKAVEEALPEKKPKSPERGESGVCLSCGKDLLPGDAFCRKCGVKRIDACVNCGKKLEVGDAFCRSCGTPFGS